MNICFFSEYFNQGGIGRVTSIIMNSLAERKEHKIYSLTYAKASIESIYYVSEIIKCDYLLEQRVSMKEAILRRGIISRLDQYLMTNHIDILIACGDLLFPISVLMKKRDRQVICWDHTSPHVNKDQQFQRISRLMGIYLSSKNVLLTEKALSVFNDYPLINKKKNYQIYNPIDPAIKCNNDYRIDSTKIISIGRLCYQKNFDRLLNVAAKVFCNSAFNNWTWDIYGIGPDWDALIKKRKALGLDNRVFFKGQVADLYNRYNDYSFIVMTSRYEGFPMALLEASANGLPMISFDIMTGPNEIINDDNGYLCNDKDDSEIVEAITRMIESPVERLRMSEGSQKSLERFSINSIINQWNDLFSIISGELLQ